MALIGTIQGAWRKNSPEIRGLFNGALPEFVRSVRPNERLEGIPVFCYHLVDAEPFEADLQHLAANGYVTIHGSDLVRHLRDEQALPERSVLLTFDDGPRNFHDVAFPLLLKFQARVTAFVAPGLHVDASSELDIEDRPMTWQEIEAIGRSGLVEFQSHTLESRFVPDWPAPVPLCGCRLDLEAQRRGTPIGLRDDLAQSCRVLEARLPGRPVTQLAFPAYEGSAAGVDAARDAGIEACYWGLRPGRALNRPGDSPYYISRISDEYLRRLPGTGRISARALLGTRLRRIQAGRERQRRVAG